MSTEEAEKCLLRIFHWPIRSCQLTGYLPLVIRRSSKNGWRLQFRFLSLPTLWSLSLLLLVGFWFVMYWKNWTGFRLFTRLESRTQIVAQVLLLFMVMGITSLFKVRGLLTVRVGFPDFWHRTCILHDNFLLTTLDDSPLEYGLLMEKLRIRTRNRVWALWIFSILLSLLYAFAEVPNFELKMVILIWSFTISLHPSYSRWVGLFIEIYTIYFEIVLDQFEKIVRNEMGKFKEETIHQKIQNAVKKFQLVDTAVKDFNHFFARPILSNILMVTIVLLVYSFYFIAWLQLGSYESIGISLGPFLLFSWDIFQMTNVADKLTRKAKEVGRCVEGIDYDLMTPGLRAQIRLLALKALSRPASLSPGSFLTVNRLLITSVVATVTIYVIILVQFENTDFN